MPLDSPATAGRTVPALGPRVIGRFNGRGLWSLYVKEVRRFLNVATQTLVAPMVTTLLFLAVFTLALGSQRTTAEGIPFAAFLAPGLTVMAMVQNAFANTSSSLVISKIQGNIVDVLMPPLSPLELTLGFALGGLTRGLLVGLAVWAGMVPFVGFWLHDPLAVVFYAVNASLMLSLLGLIGGIWSEKFDHISAVTNFIITPLSFLSGTFYSLDRLPEGWQFVGHLNPFFYMIDGFRYGVIGQADSTHAVAAPLLLAVNLGLFLLAWALFRSGYRLKA